MIDPKLIPDLPAEILLDEPAPKYLPDSIELPDGPLGAAHFGGITDLAEHARLKVILYRVKRFMADGKFRTHEEMGKACACKPTTAASKLRDLQTLGFGNHKVKREKDPEKLHCFIYSLRLNPEDEDAKRWLKEAENAHMRYYKAVQPGLFDIAI